MHISPALVRNLKIKRFSLYSLFTDIQRRRAEISCQENITKAIGSEETENTAFISWLTPSCHVNASLSAGKHEFSYEVDNETICEFTAFIRKLLGMLLFCNSQKGFF